MGKKIEKKMEYFEVKKRNTLKIGKYRIKIKKEQYLYYYHTVIKKITMVMIFF